MSVAKDLKTNTRDEDGLRPTLPSKSPERFGMCARNAKQIHKEYLRTQAVRSMAESSKRKSDALKEHNDIAVFSFLEATENFDITLFSAAVRQTYLSQALKKTRMASEEASSPIISPLQSLSPPPAQSDELPPSSPLPASSLSPSLEKASLSCATLQEISLTHTPQDSFLS